MINLIRIPIMGIVSVNRVIEDRWLIAQRFYGSFIEIIDAVIAKTILAAGAVLKNPTCSLRAWGQLKMVLPVTLNPRTLVK